MKRIIVIGGGAAGLTSAYFAAQKGAEVTLLEKNEKLGKKIYITGKGRCNFTNRCDAETFLQNVVHGAKFLKGSIYRFPPEKTISFMEAGGLATKTERGNRVFPFSDHASDVTATLERYCRGAGVTIRLQEEVQRIDYDGDCVKGVATAKGYYEADAVIVATGGLSYPSTGSTGDGYRFAKEADMSVTALRPSLVGLNVADACCKALQGLSLKNVALSVCRADGKVLYSGFGEMLFTHYGISGPLVLSASALLSPEVVGKTEAHIDLKPALDFATLESRVLRDFELYKNKQVFNAMKDLLPQALIAPVLKKSGVPMEKAVHSVTKAERTEIVKTLKCFRLKPTSLRGFEEAIVTSGGVDLKGVSAASMESTKRKGLYFCGEVLDVDAYTGGFNLQIAFATGYTAGTNAAAE